MLGKLGRIKAINEELKSAVKHEAEARDSMYIKFMLPVLDVSRLLWHSPLGHSHSMNCRNVKAGIV
jgi:hypothetical protein